MEEAALRQLHLFDGFSRKQRKLLAVRADEVQIPPGKVLCSKGATAHEFFVIEDGTARVVRDGQFLDVLGPGDYRYRGADLGVIVARSRMQDDDNQLTERARQWIEGIHSQFAGAPVQQPAEEPPPKGSMAFKTA